MYPLVGVTETKSDKVDFKIVTQSRKLVEQRLELGPFKGLTEGELTEFEYSLM